LLSLLSLLSLLLLLLLMMMMMLLTQVSVYRAASHRLVWSLVTRVHSATISRITPRRRVFRVRLE